MSPRRVDAVSSAYLCAGAGYNALVGVVKCPSPLNAEKCVNRQSPRNVKRLSKPYGLRLETIMVVVKYFYLNYSGMDDGKMIHIYHFHDNG